MVRHPHPPRLLRRALVLAALLTLAVPAGALSQGARPDAARAALAVESYYGSYGPAQALRAPEQPARAATDDSPGWTPTILVGAALIVAATGVGVLAGRASTRRAPRHEVTP